MRYNHLHDTSRARTEPPGSRAEVGEATALIKILCIDELFYCTSQKTQLQIIFSTVFKLALGRIQKC